MPSYPFPDPDLHCDGIERLINDLAKTVAHLSPHAMRRVRLAVSPDEYDQIREYFIATDNKFFGMVRGVPLVIEV